MKTLTILFLLTTMSVRSNSQCTYSSDIPTTQGICQIGAIGTTKEEGGGASIKWGISIINKVELSATMVGVYSFTHPSPFIYSVQTGWKFNLSEDLAITPLIGWSYKAFSEENSELSNSKPTAALNMYYGKIFADFTYRGKNDYICGMGVNILF